MARLDDQIRADGLKSESGCGAERTIAVTGNPSIVNLGFSPRYWAKRQRRASLDQLSRTFACSPPMIAVRETVPRRRKLSREEPIRNRSGRFFAEELNRFLNMRGAWSANHRPSLGIYR
jgi:hypothetical protein